MHFWKDIWVNSAFEREYRVILPGDSSHSCRGDNSFQFFKVGCQNEILPKSFMYQITWFIFSKFSSFYLLLATKVKYANYKNFGPEKFVKYILFYVRWKNSGLEINDDQVECSIPSTI